MDLPILLGLLVIGDGKSSLTAENDQGVIVYQYLMYNSVYWLDYRQLWTNWPDREIDGLFKWYYLVQFAFWLQQILVVNIEERRKDHWQMFLHHIITSTLIFTSYGYHMTRVGNTILCLMDVVDILFPVRKPPHQDFKHG